MSVDRELARVRAQVRAAEGETAIGIVSVYRDSDYYRDDYRDCVPDCQFELPVTVHDIQVILSWQQRRRRDARDLGQHYLFVRPRVAAEGARREQREPAPDARALG